MVYPGQPPIAADSPSIMWLRWRRVHVKLPFTAISIQCSPDGSHLARPTAEEGRTGTPPEGGVAVHMIGKISLFVIQSFIYINMGLWIFILYFGL